MHELVETGKLADKDHIQNISKPVFEENNRKKVLLG